jgi:hypothetical protein
MLDYMLMIMATSIQACASSIITLSCKETARCPLWIFDPVVMGELGCSESCCLRQDVQLPICAGQRIKKGAPPACIDQRPASRIGGNKSVAFLFNCGPDLMTMFGNLNV